MTRICILGGNGHLGFNTLLLSLEKGFAVNATFRNAQWKNHPLLTGLSFEYHLANLLDRESLRKAFQGCDVILHFAAPNMVWAKNPAEEITRPTLEGTRNVFEVASELGVKRIVMTSSCAAMGVKSVCDKPFTEEDWNLHANSALIQSKIDAEKWAWANHERLHLELFTICLPSMIGPGYLRHTPSTEIAKQLSKGSLLTFPNISFHWIDARDAAEAHLLAAICELPSQRFAAAGEFVTPTLVAEKVKQLWPKIRVYTRPIPDFALRFISFIAPKRLPRDVLEDFMGMNQRISSQKIRSLLGWKSRPLSETLQDMVNWERRPTISNS